MHHRRSFVARTSCGQNTSRCTWAWSRAITEAILETKRANTPEIRAYLHFCAMCASTMPVVYLTLYTPPPLIRRMHLVREGISRGVLAWSRAFMQAFVAPKRTSTLGDTYLGRAQAVYTWHIVNCRGVFKLTDGIYQFIAVVS